MQIITIPTMMGIIHHIGVVEHDPVAFWGKSGIGKSEAVAQSCAEHDGVLCDIRVSQYESIDFRGIPDIQRGSTVWNMPATIPFKGNPRFTEDRRPIFLFLDEINQGEPSVSSVCYQLVNDYRIGEHILMDNVVIIAAGNGDSDRGATNRFPSPLANRFIHSELVPDIKSWSVWATKAGLSPTVVGFLNFRYPLLHTFDPAKPVKAFATSRTWAKAARYFANTTMPEDVRAAAISGAVGEGPAVELGGFAKIMKSIVPIEEIIANPKGVPVEPGLDVQWAMATHVAGHMDKSNAGPLHQFLERLEPDMVVMAWTMAVNRDEDITESDAFLNQYAPAYRSLFQS